MPLEGDLVILREELEEDLPGLVRLRNDMETQAWSKALPPDYTVPMLRKRLDAREFSFDPTDARFAIIYKETGEWVGHIGYNGLDRRLGVYLGIAIDRKFWGTGAALDAQEVLLRFVFAQLGLRVVRLWTHSGNPRAISLAEKSGFRVSCRMRQAIFKDGQLLDNVLMDILREEYFALHPDLVDALPPL